MDPELTRAIHLHLGEPRRHPEPVAIDEILGHQENGDGVRMRTGWALGLIALLLGVYWLLTWSTPEPAIPPRTSVPAHPTTPPASPAAAPAQTAVAPSSPEAPAATPLSTAAMPAAPQSGPQPTTAPSPSVPPSPTPTTAVPSATPSPMSAETAMTKATGRQVQKALRRLGYDPGPMDGAFGPKTRDAVRRFQRAIGAEPTGSLTADEASRLVSAPAPTRRRSREARNQLREALAETAADQVTIR
jgi:putative peptidoglycan binding protein